MMPKNIMSLNIIIHSFVWNYNVNITLKALILKHTTVFFFVNEFYISQLNRHPIGCSLSASNVIAVIVRSNIIKG